MKNIIKSLVLLAIFASQTFAENIYHSRNEEYLNGIKIDNDFVFDGTTERFIINGESLNNLLTDNVHSLNDLSGDITITNTVDNNIIVTNKDEKIEVYLGDVEINELSNVNFDNSLVGIQGIKYENGTWTNQVLGQGVTQLNELTDVDDDLDPSDGKALVYDGNADKWIAGDVNNVQVTPVSQEDGIKIATITVNGNGTYIEIPKSNSAYDNDAGYETDADVRRIEHNVNENQTTTINLSTDINEQIFKRGDNENTTITLTLPEASEDKSGMVMIYVEEIPSKTFRYDFANDNLDTFVDLSNNKKPWMTSTNDSMWLFTFKSIPGETTWYCRSATEYPYIDPTIHPFTRAYYSDGTERSYDISGELTSSSIDENGLIGIEIGTKVTRIGNEAFAFRDSLASVTIPGSVASIRDYAFHGCTSLSSITCLASSAPTVRSSTFGNSTTTYTGRDSYSAGTNVLRIPQGATGYDSSYWADPLQNSSKCGFHIEYITE